MKNLIYSILVGICLLGCEFVYAQKQALVSGQIKDVRGGGVAGATVVVKGSAYGVAGGADGRYSLRVATGKLTLEVSSVGYGKISREVHIRRDTVIDFVLEEEAVQLASATVTGKGKNRQLKESVYAADAVDVKAAANSTVNLGELINRAAGVRVRTEGGLGSDYELSLNGMSGNAIRYFIDNVPLDIKGEGMSLVNLPLNAVERIEVYKGVVPSYLGADALGGAVNIVTRRDKRNFLDASYSIGSFHTHIAELNAQVCLPRTGVVVKPSLGVNYSRNDYTVKGVELWDEESRKYVPRNVKRFHDDYLSLFAQLEAGMEDRKWADALYVSGSYSKTDKELQTGSVQNIVYGMAERQQEAWNVAVRYTKRDFLTEGLQVNALVSQTWDRSVTVDTAFRKYRWDGSYINSSRNEITGRGKQMRHYARPLGIARLNADYRLGEHHSFNLNYMMHRSGNKRHDSLDEDFVPTNDVLTKHITGATYGQSFLEEKLANSFFVKEYIYRVKAEQKDLSWITHSDEVPGEATKHFLGYGAGTRYRFFAPLAVKASYEHAVRLPLAKELLGNGVTVYANLALEPEKSDNFNAGFYGEVKAGEKHVLSYEATGFFRKVKDYIRAVTSESDGTMQYQNVSKVNVKGVEGEVRYRYGQLLQLKANGSYQDSRNMDKLKADGKPSVIYKNKIPNKPWLYGNAEAVFTLPDAGCKGSSLQLSYQYRYVHWFFLTWEGYGTLDSKSRIPTQHLHGAEVAYSWQEGRYNLSVECSNLFDSKVYDNFMLQKPGRAFACKFRIFLH